MSATTLSEHIKVSRTTAFIAQERLEHATELREERGEHAEGGEGGRLTQGGD